MKVKEIIKLIENDGWMLIRTNGSHRHYAHPDKKGLVTVPGKLNSDIPVGTMKSILNRQD